MKIIVIGLGSMGKRRIRLLSERKDIQLFGIDSQESRCAEVKEKFGLKCYASIADAVAELKALADSQNAQAEYILAQYHEKEDKGWCNSQSVKLLTLSAEHGCADAQYKLGEWYRKPEHNDGVRGNIEEAAKWFRKAAEQGHKEAADALESLETLF